MALFQLPTISGLQVTEHYYSERIELEGQRWLFEFAYNSRIDAWCVTITPELGGEPVVSQAPLWLGVDVLDGTVHPVLTGTLFCVATGAEQQESGLLGLGAWVELAYITADEDFSGETYDRPVRVG